MAASSRQPPWTKSFHHPRNCAPAIIGAQGADRLVDRESRELARWSHHARDDDDDGGLGGGQGAAHHQFTCLRKLHEHARRANTHTRRQSLEGNMQLSFANVGEEFDPGQSQRLRPVLLLRWWWCTLADAWVLGWLADQRREVKK